MAKVIKNISAVGFTGMHNLLRPPALLVDKITKLITPSCLLNADAVNGTVLKRQGFSRKVTLTKPHSLWSDGITMFCVAQGTNAAQVLYRLGPDGSTELQSLPGSVTPLFYVRIDDKIFCSSALWRGVYNLRTDSLQSWGATLPVGPRVSLAAGDLVPAHYRICYTSYDNNILSGNGPIIDVYWDSGNRGIKLENKPSNAQVWITHPNGGDFFLASVENDIISSHYGVQRLPTLDVIPPPYLESLRYAFGRVWGSSGEYLYYSEPMQYDWFKKKNMFKFDQDIAIVAPVTDGIFVASKEKTWFLAGSDPAKMRISHTIEVGAIPGTQATGMVAGGGYQVSRKLSQIETSIWASSVGIAMGVQGGHILYLTDGQNDLCPRQRGSSLVRSYQGLQQIVTTFVGPLVAGDMPSSISESIKMGRL